MVAFYCTSIQRESRHRTYKGKANWKRESTGPRVTKSNLSKGGYCTLLISIESYRTMSNYFGYDWSTGFNLLEAGGGGWGWMAVLHRMCRTTNTGHFLFVVKSTIRIYASKSIQPNPSLSGHTGAHCSCFL